MERTEGTVVQVAPSFENAKIHEMEAFGWNLQGRQEIHEVGDAFGRPSFTSNVTYLIKTKVSHYVKLHFVRNLALPNIARIRKLESEYSGLPFPAPLSFLWPIIITAFPILCMMAQESFVFLVGLVPCILWIRSRMGKNRAAAEIRAASAERAEKIMGETLQLTSVAQPQPAGV